MRCAEIADLALDVHETRHAGFDCRFDFFRQLRDGQRRCSSGWRRRRRLSAGQSRMCLEESLGHRPIAPSGPERLDQQSELGLRMLVGDFMFVEWEGFDLLLRRAEMMMHREDGARRADIVAQAVADHRAAGDPRGQVHAIAIAERAEGGFILIGKGLEKAGDFRVWPALGDLHAAAEIAEEGNVRQGEDRPLGERGGGQCERAPGFRR